MSDLVLAQANIATMRYDPTDPRMAPFVDALDRVNAEADDAPGFVWRLQTDAGNSLDVRAFDDPRVLFNLSVWESIEDLFRYTYRSGHAEIFRRRHEWFEAQERPPVVMWWIPRTHTPTVQEALTRFEWLWSRGSTHAAFDFRTPFGPDGSALESQWRRRIGVGASCALVLTLACGGGPAVPDFVDCSVFGAPAQSEYVLPYQPGQRWEVGNTFGHYTPLNGGVGLYAIDFRMPIGTEVTAARAGTVVAIEEGFSDDDHQDYHENWVMVEHADGTIGRYIHLTRNGALVEIGQTVAQGEVIGLSGNSGASSRPHLHFDVQSCGPNLPPGYNDLPCGHTVPVTFRNTAAHSCGLAEDRFYRADTFTPDDR